MMIFKVILLQSVLTLFGEGTLSTEKVDYGIAFTPDENVAYVVRHDGEWGSRVNPPSKIHRYVKKDEKWINTGYADFSDKDSPWSDSGIFISPNGELAFFVSNRPYQGKSGESDPDIFMMTKNGDKWSKPSAVEALNSPGYEASPVTDKEGNIYFSSIRQEGLGLGDIYMSRVIGTGEYSKPELLEGSINSPSGEWNLIISPDAEWIIFESSGRADGSSPYGDLYLSRKNTTGDWSEPTNLKALNTTGSDLNPRILYKSNKLVWASSQKLEHTGTDFFSLSLKEIEVNIKDN
ncbi:MAG: hypothetical protein CL670_07180 [Balneola sp.]|jgi:hypothetical protein|nr:hypothetical protein [Balneola sp.]MBE78917.1 hypothetical protein [Balneola sp.]|tara:strand:- start:4997 stop:5872 length:876 start_codon:yes stop_codon:yes gene_type:complete